MDSFSPAVPWTMQDLKAVNDSVQNSIARDSLWNSVLDLKDAFFCIPVDQDSWPLFAFEWQNPESQVMTQHCWTALLKGFKNSPMIWGATPNQDLKDLLVKLGERTLLTIWHLVAIKYQHESPGLPTSTKVSWVPAWTWQKESYWTCQRS